MPDGDQPEEDEGSERYRRKSTYEQCLSDPIRTIGKRLEALILQRAASDQKHDEREDRNQRAAQRRHNQATGVHLASAFLTAILSALTLVVLYKTLGVYSRQASIMGQQRQLLELSTAPRVIISLEPLGSNKFLLAARNVGHQTAENVRIFWDTKRNPPPTFVPPMMNPHPNSKDVWTAANLKQIHDRDINEERARMQMNGIPPDQIEKKLAPEIELNRKFEKQVEFNVSLRPEGADSWLPEVPTLDAASYVGFVNITRHTSDILWYFGHCKYDYGKPSINTFDSPFCISVAADGAIGSCLNYEIDEYDG